MYSVKCNCTTEFDSHERVSRLYLEHSIVATYPFSDARMAGILTLAESSSKYNQLMLAMLPFPQHNYSQLDGGFCYRLPEAMLHTMTSGGPFRDSWRTPYNIQTQFFHPNYTFPIFHHSLSYPFFPSTGTFYSPAIFNRSYLELTENRPLIPFDTSSSARIFLSSPYPYSMQMPSISNPFMDQGFTSSDISTRYLLQNPSTNFNISGSNQPFASFTTDASLRNIYGSESTACIPVKNKKRKRDSSAEDTWSGVPSVTLPTGEFESSGGAIDLSINSDTKRQRIDTCFSACNSVPVVLKTNNNNDRDSKRHICAPKTGDSTFLALDMPSSSYTGTVTVGNISQERQNVQSDVVPIKNESSEKAPLPTSSQTTLLSPDSLHGSEIFNHRGLDLMPGCSRMWTSSVPETNANRPLIPDILNIPFNPFFPPLLPNPNIGVNWWMDAPFNPYPSGVTSNSSSFDFANPLGIKREEIASTAAASSSGLDVSVAEEGTEDSINSPQLDSTGFEASASEPKSEAPVSVGSSETEKPTDTETTIKLEDIIITRPTEEPKLQDSPQPQIMRNWLLENLERGLKQESVFRIRKVRHFDIRGLKLLSRGIEKIERHSGKGRLTGLGLLCALAEERMRDDIGVPDEDSLENNSVESEISETEEVRIEVDIEQNDNELEGKPVKVGHRQEEFNSSPTGEDLRVESKYSEESDSGPPLLVKADDIPVWNSEDQNRPPTLSPNTKQDSQLRSDTTDLISSARPVTNDMHCDGGEEKQNEQIEDNNATSSESLTEIKKGNREEGQGNAECSYGNRKLLLRKSSDLEKKKVKAKIGDVKTTDQCNARVKEERNGIEKDDSSLEQLWKKEESVASCSGPNKNEFSTKDNKRRGKLILRLRRERLRKSEEEKSRPKSCVLTTERLMTSKFPVKILTVDTGLFYTGQLSAIRPPDVYGITIDGERGNRPHIYSREEVLNNSFFEVNPTSKKDLPPGARVCAYWSERCRCLYPGSVSASVIVDPDPNSVNIEFDDGDSCRISINNIRLLPENYPITECNPNPFAKPGKKKKRLNVKEDEDCQNHANVPTTSETSVIKDESPKQNFDTVAFSSKSNEEADTNLWEGKKKSHASTDRGKHKKKHKHRHRHHKKKHSERISESSSFGRKKKKAKTRGTGIKSKRSVPVLIRKPWGWCGKGFRRPGIKGKARKEYYRAIKRGNERIVIGECAVFLSSGRPDRPFIGRIESMWETWGANMVVRVKWFYHPEETVGCPATLEYPGALFESPHSDENDVQTISHKCEVLPLKRYIEKLGKGAKNNEGSTKLYYLAGFYDPTNTSLEFQEGVK